MWISRPTPVTSRIHVIDRGSACVPTCTENVPAGIQVKIWFTWRRPAAGRSSSEKSITSETRNASAIRPLAIQPAMGSPMRRPNSSSSAAPKSGNNGTIPM